jgi:hypothetical protein
MEKPDRSSADPATLLEMRRAAQVHNEQAPPGHWPTLHMFEASAA